MISSEEFDRAKRAVKETFEQIYPVFQGQLKGVKWDDYTGSRIKGKLDEDVRVAVRNESLRASVEETASLNVAPLCQELKTIEEDIAKLQAEISRGEF